MTKEELDKEADKWLVDNLHSTEEDYKLAYLAGAEPREKQIQIDAEQIIALQKDKGELTDKVKELKAQIEKMKQCGNCGNRTIGNCEYCKRNPSQIFADTLTSDYWKLRR